MDEAEETLAYIISAIEDHYPGEVPKQLSVYIEQQLELFQNKVWNNAWESGYENGYANVDKTY